MAFSLTWLPEVLHAAGLKVAETPGWSSRGRSEFGRPEGVMCHHTATKKIGNMPSLNTLIVGRSDLSGPLCHLGLGRDGTYYVVAAGRANHAGAGAWAGVINGNSRFIGIEAENSGLASEAWPDVQRDAYVRGVAALLRHIGKGAERCCGHGEYALPAGRKNDPRLPMEQFRADVRAALAGTFAARPLIQPIDASARPTLRRGDHGEPVRELQRRLGLADDGIFGALTEAAVRTLQRERDLVPDGIVGPKTWSSLDG